jgi:hypothetical protein
MTTDPDTFDIGPTPPPWTLPGAQPAWDSLSEGGATVLSWARDISDQVWIAADTTITEGQWVDTWAAIMFCEPPRDSKGNKIADDVLNQ